MQARLAALFGERGGDDRLRIRERRVDLREDDAARRVDLAIDAEEFGLPLRVAVDEAPLAADAQIDLADRHRVSVAQIAPPAPDVLGLAHRLEHQGARRVEEPREVNLRVGRSGDLERLAICYAACRHVFSPSLSFAADRARGCRSAVPRFFDTARSTRPLP